ncbi:MAG: hypothetical protein Q9195_009623 [Heterodermia aff. obscurata]
MPSAEELRAAVASDRPWEHFEQLQLLVAVIHDNPPHNWARIEQSGQLPKGHTALQSQGQLKLLIEQVAARMMAEGKEEEAATQPKKRKRAAAATAGRARGGRSRPQEQRPGVAGGLGAAEGDETEEDEEDEEDEDSEAGPQPKRRGGPALRGGRGQGEGRGGRRGGGRGRRRGSD